MREGLDGWMERPYKCHTCRRAEERDVGGCRTAEKEVDK